MYLYAIIMASKKRKGFIMRNAKKVHVYRNLHKKGMFSIRLSGKVIDHASVIRLSGDVGFHINENGRVRVTKQRKKNVHAWVKAENYEILSEAPDLSNHVACFYDPYFTQYFHCMKTGNTLESAEEIIMANNRAYALNPVYVEQEEQYIDLREVA